MGTGQRFAEHTTAAGAGYTAPRSRLPREPAAGQATLDDGRGATAGAPSSSPPKTAGEFRRGALTMLPLLPGYAPLACLIGVTVAASHAPAAAWSGVWLIFAGTAHLAVVQQVDAGAGVLVAAASALLINLRLALFSATLAQHWRGTGLLSRLVAAATVVDPTWMLASRRFAEPGGPAAGRRFYFGVSTVLWFGFAGMVTIGMVAGRLVPPQAGLTLLAPLCLVAMVVPAVRSASAAGGVAAAAAAAVAAAALPAGTALLVAMPAGVAGALIGRRLAGKDRTT